MHLRININGDAPGICSVSHKLQVRSVGNALARALRALEVHIDANDCASTSITLRDVHGRPIGTMVYVADRGET